MPWSETSIMEQRREFVMLFEQEGVNRRALCRRFGISPETGYALVRRYRQEGTEGLADRSRRPQRSPGRTAVAMETVVLSVRDAHPTWGGRKIRRRLQDLGHEEVPSASTITEVLRRHDRIDPAASAAREQPQRFERMARYCPSPRCFPETLEPFDYGPGAILRRVDDTGWLSFRGQPLKLGRAFIHRQVALRPALPDGCFDVFFCGHKVATFDLREPVP